MRCRRPVLAARQLLACILRFMERQHGVAVGILKVVGEGEPLVQYAPCPSLTLSTHVPLVLLRRYISEMPARATVRCTACGGSSIAAVRCGFPVR